LGEALTSLDPPVRALMVYNSNPASVAPDASRVRQGLLREDLFTVVHEQVMTPTALYADLLLPATTSLENRDLYNSYGHYYLADGYPVVPARGECKSNFELFQTLAQKMGYQDEPFQQTIEERIQDYLSTLSGLPEEVDWEAFKQGAYIRSTAEKLGEPMFDGKEQKFSFVTPSNDPALPKIACLTPMTDRDDANLKSRYPYYLITPPNGKLLNSTFGEQYQDEIGKVLIHPQNAGPLQIQTGDLVRLMNGRGYTDRQAKVTDDTQPGVLVAEGIYWQATSGIPTGINDLTSQNVTDMGEGGTFHESLVDLQLVK